MATELYKYIINKKKSIALVEKNGDKLIQLRSDTNRIVTLSAVGFVNLHTIAKSLGELNPDAITITDCDYYIQGAEKNKPMFLRVVKLSQVTGRAPGEGDPFVVDIRSYTPRKITGDVIYHDKEWGLCYNLISWNIMVSKAFPQIEEQLVEIDGCTEWAKTTGFANNTPTEIYSQDLLFGTIEPSYKVDKAIPEKQEMPPDSPRPRKRKRSASWLGRTLKSMQNSKMQMDGGEAVKILSDIKPEKVKLMSKIMVCYVKEMIGAFGSDADFWRMDKNTIVKLFEQAAKEMGINETDPFGLYEYCSSSYAKYIVHSAKHPGGWSELNDGMLVERVKPAAVKSIAKRKKRENKTD